MNNKSMMKHRLNDPINKFEEFSLNYCKKSINGTSIENILKENVLKLYNHPAELSDEQNKYLKILKENPEAVDIVLDTVFQWIGTHVGYNKMKRLVKKLDQEGAF